MIIRMIINAIYLFLIILGMKMLSNLLYINLIFSKKIKIQLINV